MRELYDRVVHRGDSGEVVPVGFTDCDAFYQAGKRQRMDGFDPQYRDIVDYIIKITHQIWEERSLGSLYDTYAEDIVMHFGSKDGYGRPSVIAGTLETLHSFPDRVLVGENIIWSGDCDEGFLSSHRILSHATNLGDSAFGPATGKRAVFRTIADCFVKDNYISEEWLVRDNLGLVLQLGLDPVEVASRTARGAKSPDFEIPAPSEPEIYRPVHSGFDAGDFCLEFLNQVHARKSIDQVDRFYAESIVTHTIANEDLPGRQRLKDWLVSFYASFPNAEVRVERVTVNQGPAPECWDAAVRFTITGINNARGYFGAATGRPVKILVITHLKIFREKIVEEWLVLDGLDVLRQMHISEDITPEHKD